ncbi:MAG: hypothetical protein HY718_01710 [Planctomycetes bacterium]|nr:hypothetical protein [Planctomycetota bacterium]
MSLCPDRYATPTDLSADAGVIVGYQYHASRAFRWTEHALWDIGTVPKGVGVSADGTVLLANKYGSRRAVWPDWLHPNTVPAYNAHLWQNWALTDLGSITGVEGTTCASAISADGRVVCGGCYTPTLFWEAFRWTAEGGMVGLGAAPGCGGGTTRPG